MRGDGIRYAMEHAGPELGQKIWDELMRPKPSMDKIREAKVRELKEKMLCLEALQKVMEKRFPSTDYCVGGYQEEAVCIQLSQNGWIVYCGERGNHYEQVERDTVLSACLEFIRKMTHNKDDIIDMENELISYIAQEGSTYGML